MGVWGGEREGKQGDALRPTVCGSLSASIWDCVMGHVCLLLCVCMDS